MEHEPVEQAVDGRVATDGEGQRENRHRRKRWTPHELTQRIPRILNQGIHLAPLWVLGWRRCSAARRLAQALANLSHALPAGACHHVSNDVDPEGGGAANTTMLRLAAHRLEGRQQLRAVAPAKPCRVAPQERFVQPHLREALLQPRIGSRLVHERAKLLQLVAEGRPPALGELVIAALCLLTVRRLGLARRR